VSAVDALFWRDEILQVMFWLRGEGLSEVVTPSEVARLLAADAAMVAARLGAMAADGYVVADGAAAPRYRLSALGAELGGRSFQDEFAGLTRQAHGECGPGCWCHDPGREGEPCPNREPQPTPEPSHA
jgi:hypothetical protein